MVPCTGCVLSHCQYEANVRVVQWLLRTRGKVAGEGIHEAKLEARRREVETRK